MYVHTNRPIRPVSAQWWCPVRDFGVKLGMVRTGYGEWSEPGTEDDQDMMAG